MIALHRDGYSLEEKRSFFPGRLRIKSIEVDEETDGGLAYGD